MLILKIKDCKLKPQIYHFIATMIKRHSNHGRKYGATKLTHCSTTGILCLWLYNPFLLDELQISSSTSLPTFFVISPDKRKFLILR